MKKRLLLFLLANGIFFGFAQNPIIVVDGFFLKLNKNEIIEYIGIENIKDTIIISPDSAKVLLGIYGENGLFIINTKEPNSKLSTSLRVDRNLFFENKPVFLINDNIINDFDINMVDPNDVDSIVIIHPYNSIKEYGIDYAGGIINIWVNNDSLSKYLSKNIPLNFNEIKTISLTDDYSILLKRYLHNDTTLLLRDFQILYYGQAYQNNFNPYSRHDSIQALNILLNKPIESIDFNQVLNYCLIILEDYPFSIEQVFFTAIAYKEMDEIEKSLVFFNKYHMLIETILSSGDGLSPETAMVVLNTSDEYSVINAIGFQAEMQSLTRINGKNYDIIKLFENDYNIEELYFDIDLFFGKWK